MKTIQFFLLFTTLTSIPILSNCQKVSFSIGTDIPYQFYIGGAFETSNIDIAYRTGVLTSPYSNLITNTLEAAGTDQVYIDLLEASFNLGWMNSLGVYYKFGNLKSWYIGPEIRIDKLTASEASIEILETLVNQPINTNGQWTGDIQAELGMNMVALGFRFGKSIPIGEMKKHRLRFELSLAKHISTQSTLLINNRKNENLNLELNEMLWEDVFKKYGYIGGVGVGFTF